MEKIALITGASKGIGKAFAYIFAKNGYSLILLARTLSELEELQRELKTKYQCVSKILTIDLQKPGCIDKTIDAIKDDLPRLEVLINNAGFGISKKLIDTPEEDIDGMLTVNINVLTKLTYRILPFMLANKKGKILNVASTAAYVPGPNMAIYYATKAYVLSFSEALYEEYRKDGITVTALCPGVTRSAFHQRAGHTRLVSSRFIPIMSAEDVAAMGYKGLMKNKRVIVAGFFNKISIILMTLMPKSILLKVLGIINNGDESSPQSGR